MSITDAIELKLFLELPSDWLPILNGGEGLFLYLKDEPGESTMLYHHELVHRDFTCPIYDSLHSLIRTATACVNAGAYRFDSSGMEADYEQEIAISRLMNPNSSYWNESEFE
jgi:hypothetical protein